MNCQLCEFKLDLGLLPVPPGYDQILYVGTRYNKTFEDYIKTHYMELRCLFQRYRLEFVYLPIFNESIGKDDFDTSVLYFFPWLKRSELYRYREMFMERAKSMYDGLEIADGIPVLVNADGRAFKLSVTSPSDSALFRLFSDIVIEYDSSNDCECCYDRSCACSEHADDHTLNSRLKDDSIPGIDSIDPDLMYMLGKLVKQKPNWAIKAVLSKMLQEEEIISRLIVTRHAKIVLPDYNDIEIKLTPKEKAIYFLYLKHPEGICFKNLPDYRDELLRYYRHVSKSGDPAAINATVDTMILSISGDADVQRARIKYAINKAFSNQFCDQYSRYYTIEGSKGQALRIELPVEKIIWELDI